MAGCGIIGAEGPEPVALFGFDAFDKSIVSVAIALSQLVVPGLLV